jgi:uncharacterized membrane protein
MGFRSAILKTIFGIVVVVGTFFLWSFPTGQLWLILIVCFTIAGYAVFKTQFDSKSKSEVNREKGNEFLLRKNNNSPPSFVCPSCHKGLTFLEEYNR